MAEAKKGRGCFFYGCLTTAVVVILGIVGIYIGARVFWKHNVNKYTATNGVAIAPISIPREQGKAVLNKVEDFLADLKAGKATGPLELTSDELDYFLRNSEGWAHMRDHFHIAVNNGRVTADLSFPLEAMHPSMKGRFLNATAELKPKIENGALVIEMQSVQAKGQTVPAKILAGFQQGMRWKPDGNELESIEVKDESIVLVPKIKAKEPAKAL
jgi:hypothetical protein